jgi:hypothetical protein
MTIFVAGISFFSNGVPRYQSSLLPSSFMTIFVAGISFFSNGVPRYQLSPALMTRPKNKYLIFLPYAAASSASGP